jgi:hypothetical protein
MEDKHMLTFKSPDDPAYSTVKELIEQLITAYSPSGRAYDAEDDGYIILVEPEDADRTLDELWDGCSLLRIPWEGVFLRDGCPPVARRSTLSGRSPHGHASGPGCPRCPTGRGYIYTSESKQKHKPNIQIKFLIINAPFFMPSAHVRFLAITIDAVMQKSQP